MSFNRTTNDREVMISVRGLGKSYSIAQSTGPQPTTLAEAAISRLRRPMHRAERETFWALRDVSFDVRRGDVVGVIGRNGAGKSTLFKVLSRITEPTNGEVDLYGRVGSLLEVGTGFSGELTGRENIFLNGAILGMRRAEIAKRFDEIVEFAGVGKFLDTPVKRYSSGMYVRLAFAVAANLDTDILIIDEVLAVGDQEFQRKCLRKMKSVAQSGRTILFVSHSMTAVRQLCSQVVFLENGQCKFVGGTDDGIQFYLDRASQDLSCDQSAAKRRHGSGEYRFGQVKAAKQIFLGHEPKVIEFDIVRVGGSVADVFLSAHVKDENDVVLCQYDSRLMSTTFPDVGDQRGRLTFATPWLKPGRYRIDIAICSASVIDYYPEACSFEVAPDLPYHVVDQGAIPPQAYEFGAVFGEFLWTLDGSRAQSI